MKGDEDDDDDDDDDENDPDYKPDVSRRNYHFSSSFFIFWGLYFKI